MTAPQVDATLTAQFVEEKPRQGKDPYYLVHYVESYTVGEYTGTTAALWSANAAGIVREKLASKQAIYTIRGSEKNPTYSGSIDRILDPSTGEILYQADKQKGGSGGGGGKGGGRGPGDWETHTEREFKAASIEACTAAKVLADAVSSGAAIGEVDPATYIAENVEAVAVAIRKATKKVYAQEGGYPVKAAAPPPAAAPASGSASTSSPQSGPDAAQGPGAGTPPGTTANGSAKNIALQRFGGTLPGVEAAFTQAFGGPKKFLQMTDEELTELVEWANLTSYGAAT